MNCLSSTLSALFLTLLALPGCGAQKDGDYQGDALASIHGTVVVEGEAQTSVQLAVAWTNIFASSDFNPSYEVQGVTVEASFPGRFRLDVVAPPSRRAFTDFSLGGSFPGNGLVAVGNIVALRGGPNDKYERATRDAVAGWVKDQVLLYVAGDVAPNSAAANFMGGPLSPGFHLMNVKRLTSAEQGANAARRIQCYRDSGSPNDDATWDLCGIPLNKEIIEVHEAPAGFDTLVTLKLAPPDRLDLPSEI